MLVPIIINGPSCALNSVCVINKPAGFLLVERLFHSAYCGFSSSLWDHIISVTKAHSLKTCIICLLLLPTTATFGPLITVKPPCPHVFFVCVCLYYATSFGVSVLLISCQ